MNPHRSTVDDYRWVRDRWNRTAHAIEPTAEENPDNKPWALVCGRKLPAARAEPVARARPPECLGCLVAVAARPPQDSGDERGS